MGVCMKKIKIIIVSFIACMCLVLFGCDFQQLLQENTGVEDEISNGTGGSVEEDKPSEDNTPSEEQKPVEDNKNKEDDIVDEIITHYTLAIYNTSSEDANVYLTTEEGDTKYVVVNAHEKVDVDFDTLSETVKFRMVGLFFDINSNVKVDSGEIKPELTYSLIRLTNKSQYRVSSFCWGDNKALTFNDGKFQVKSGVVNKDEVLYFKVSETDYSRFKQIYFRLNYEMWDRFMLRQVQSVGAGEICNVSFTDFSF